MNRLKRNKPQVLSDLTRYHIILVFGMILMSAVYLYCFTLNNTPQPEDININLVEREELDSKIFEIMKIDDYYLKQVVIDGEVNYAFYTLENTTDFYVLPEDVVVLHPNSDSSYIKIRKFEKRTINQELYSETKYVDLDIEYVVDIYFESDTIGDYGMIEKDSPSFGMMFIPFFYFY